LAAAWAVLVSHSFVIVSGDSNDEPLAMWLGVTPGTLAVDAFFFLSGLLVAGSLMNASDYGWRGVWHYVLARLLRIYPAIIIMTVATAVALGYFFSNLEFASFVRHENTWIYILKNITLVAGTTGNLPGVFSEAPFPKVVNASLWTLPWEVRMYIGLLATWLFAYCFGSKRYVIFEIAVASIAVFSFCAHLHSLFTEGIVDQRRRLLFLFFAGSTLWLLKSKVLLSGKMVVALLLILAAASANKTLFSSIYQPILLYILLWVAYVPAGMIRSFNKLGDYSYGT
jgi:peptidoglycan/LPS O-acetylase OafA/YrhL